MKDEALCLTGGTQFGAVLNGSGRRGDVHLMFSVLWNGTHGTSHAQLP